MKLKRVHGIQRLCGLVLFCAATPMVLPAQVNLTTLVSFDRTDGSSPSLVLTQGADGNLYGTTTRGGASGVCKPGCGTFFKVTSAGALTTLYSFCSQTNCTDGAYPGGSLVQAANGDFYGTTSRAGANGIGGTVYRMTSGGILTTLYSFCALQNCVDGEEPTSGLVQGTTGSVYGTTIYGGANSGGTVFEITPAGKLITLYNFCALGGCADGAIPNAGLVQASDGNFYGEASAGGTTGCGTVFKIIPPGKLTTLFDFDLTDGCIPNGGLIQAADGDFYGVTAGGGSGFNCEATENCGTVFEITSAGKLTTLYDFCTGACTDGAEPVGPLAQGTDGNFYGVTYGYPASGPASQGTTFEITPEGTLTTLFTFGRDYGYQPEWGLLQATSGSFYGTNSTGGPDGHGTIFNLSVGLGPFVKTQPASAAEGTTIGIFGQGFNRSSVAQFDGVQATSVKLSGPSFLFATVPAGALTGSLTVTTDGTTLTSNQEFRVTPQLLSFNPPSGAVGTQVTITGTGFTQTTGVGFGDNVPAQFTVNSDTQVTASVPTGARTGLVGVATKGGTAVSSTTFTVN